MGREIQAPQRTLEPVGLFLASPYGISLLASAYWDCSTVVAYPHFDPIATVVRVLGTLVLAH